MIILVGGSKGGTGKSTVVTNLAAISVSNGQDTILVDTDRQGSAALWSETRDQAESGLTRVSTVQKYGKAGLTNELKALGSRYDHVFVDAGGYDSPELRSAMMAANKLIIPVRPAQMDVWAIPRIVEIVQEAQDYNPNLTYLFLINGAHTSPNVKDVDEIMELLEGFPVAQTILHHRRAYAKAPMLGMAVTELGKERDQKAADEMMSVYQEVING